MWKLFRRKLPERIVLLNQFGQKKIVELPTITSIARSLGAKKTTPFIFGTVSTLVDRCTVLSDEQAVSALFQFLDEEKSLIEPAASCSIAAALENRDYLKGKKIVIIVCGANIHLKEVLEWKTRMDLT
jgi:threonine dehydratase